MPAPRRLVVIMTDTQRHDMLSCVNPLMRTPCLDRLASQGLRYERAYTCQPVCGPARSALFTGTWPHSNGGWANTQAPSPVHRNLGQRLSDQGFHCAHIGKWHLDAGDYFGQGRADAGWDPAWWYDMRNYLDELTPEQRLWSRNHALAANLGGVDPGLTFARRCADRARAFLAKHGDEDFCLVVSFDEPHHPWVTPPEFLARWRGFRWPVAASASEDLAGKPEHQRVWSAAAGDPEQPMGRCIEDYMACNEFVDQEIGRVLAAIDAHAPDALVVYTSDHGDHLGAHRLNNKGPTAYDEIARIPFLVRWPGRVPAGAVCHHPGSHIDLVPTLMEAAACTPSPMLEGRSVLAQWRDPAQRVQDEVFVEFGRYETDHDGFGGFQPLRAVTDGRRKLVVNLLGSDELYDLEADPHELANRIADPALAAERDRLHDRLLAWMDRSRDPFRGWHWERRPWRGDAPPPTWANHGMTRQRVEDPRYEIPQLDYETGLRPEGTVRRK